MVAWRSRRECGMPPAPHFLFRRKVLTSDIVEIEICVRQFGIYANEAVSRWTNLYCNLQIYIFNAFITILFGVFIFRLYLHWNPFKYPNQKEKEKEKKLLSTRAERRTFSTAASTGDGYSISFYFNFVFPHTIPDVFGGHQYTRSPICIDYTPFIFIYI